MFKASISLLLILVVFSLSLRFVIVWLLFRVSLLFDVFELLGGDVVEGDELDEELEEREGVGEPDDSVLTVVDELVSGDEVWWWIDWAAVTFEIVRGFSRFGRICTEATLFLRWLNRSEKSFMVGLIVGSLTSEVESDVLNKNC